MKFGYRFHGMDVSTVCPLPVITKILSSLKKLFSFLDGMKFFPLYMHSTKI